MVDKTPQAQERRQYERLSKQATITYRCMDEMANDHANHDARLCDFSGGGARFLTNELLSKNLQLLLNLEFNGWQNNSGELLWTGSDSDVGKLKAIGIVMWCSTSADKTGFYEAGVRFVGRVS